MVSSRPALVRAIGRWSLAALTINCIIGSGVFGLPSVIAGMLGNASPFAWIVAALATGLVMACFAEVSSRFEGSGGVYLYSRAAFGRTVGIAVAWFGLLARLTAIGANANLFVIYLGEFWPRANALVPRTIVLFLLFGFLAWVNYVGVRRGTTLSNVFTAIKLITLLAFIAAGLAFLAFHHRAFVLSRPAGSEASWFRSILLLMFAYGGFETALTPGGEAKDPRRDYPFALFTALVTCTVVYTLAQWIVISVVPLSAMTTRPIAAAIQAMVGPTGAWVVSLAILASTYGYLSANILGFPRILFALAEQGDVPEVLARVHNTFRTPHVAIAVLSACALAFSLAGSFQWNVLISATSRLLYYGSVCAALLVLRRKREAPQAIFHLPLGNLVAVLALVVSLLLFPELDRRGLIVLAVIAFCVAAHSLWAARNARAVSLGEQKSF